MMKKLSAVGIALLMLLCLLTGCAADAPAQTSSAAQAPASSSVPEPPQPTVTTLRFSATGDNLIHDGLFLQARDRAAGAGYDFDYLYENVADFYAGFDINWLNQETLLTDDYAPAGYPCFASPTALGHKMYDLGFRVFSLSNNHSYDKGAGGIASTRAFWATMPQDTVTTGEWAGQADYSRIPVQEIGGIKIAYLSYTEHTNGIPTPAEAEANVIYTDEAEVIQQQITVAKQQADLVFVGVHMGVEGSHAVSENQRAWFQQVADWGADAIIGTHPHVVQDMAYLTASDGRTVPAAFSLGNFANLQSSADNLIGMIMTMDITVTTQPDGTVSDIALGNMQAVPVVMHYEGGYRNGRLYLLSDYTDELAAQHGIRVLYPSWSTAYINQVLCDNVSSKFLPRTVTGDI